MRWMGFFALGTIGCAGTQSPTARAPDEARPGPVVVLASGPLMEPLDNIARHAWFGVKLDREPWERWEVWYKDDGENHWGWVARRELGPLEWQTPEAVLVHGTLEGDRARTFIGCLRERSPEYALRNVYIPFPGPNSNTYVDRMLRECDWHVELPPTAVGKDFHVVQVGRTTGGTGLQLETAAGGMALGFYEGFEIHGLGLTVGVSFWPPAIKLPFGTGRLGFEPRGG